MKTNIGTNERWISAIAGGALASLGVARLLGRNTASGAALAAAGGALLFRGSSGFCAVKGAISGSGPVRLDRTVTIPNKPPEEVYEFWRNLENLPRIIPNLESVKILDERRSRWAAKGPAGKSIEWDAEIVNDRRGHLIEWRSLPGSAVDISGMVRFKRKPGRGTKVHVSLQFTTPGGRIGEALANLLNEHPEERVDAGLQSMKDALSRSEEPQPVHG